MRSRRAPKGRAIAERVNRGRSRAVAAWWWHDGPNDTHRLTPDQQRVAKIWAADLAVTLLEWRCVRYGEQRGLRGLTGIDDAPGPFGRCYVPGSTLNTDDMAAVRADWDRLGEEWSDG